jgi:hypothetical protein
MDLAQEQKFGLGDRPTRMSLFKWSQSTNFEWPTAWTQTLYAWAHAASLSLTVNATHFDDLEHYGDTESLLAEDDPEVQTNADHAVYSDERGSNVSDSRLSDRIPADVDQTTWNELLERLRSRPSH